MRVEKWKVGLMERGRPATLRAGPKPVTTLRLSKAFDMRAEPVRAGRDQGANHINSGWTNRCYILFAAQRGDGASSSRNSGLPAGQRAATSHEKQMAK